MRNNRRKYDENSLFNKSEFSASDNEIRNKNRKFGNTIKPDRPMKKKLLILLGVLTTRCIAAGQPTGCEPYEVLQRRADSLFLSGNYQSSSEIFERILSTKQRQNKDFYNGACAAALVGDTATAFERLNRLLSENKRWYSVRMQDDPYLVSLHRDERWKTLIETMEKRRAKAEANFDKPLRKELLEIFNEDQRIRREFIEARNPLHPDPQKADSLAREMRITDSLNQSKIIRILDTQGWVGKDKVGNATKAFFIVLQHASTDIQKRYLSLARKAAKRKDISGVQLGMLEYRIAVSEGRKQKYGSQIITDENGIQRIAPLKDPARVDRWRKSAGFSPLSDYIRRMELEWGSRIERSE